MTLLMMIAAKLVDDGARKGSLHLVGMLLSLLYEGHNSVTYSVDDVCSYSIKGHVNYEINARSHGKIDSKLPHLFLIAYLA